MMDGSPGTETKREQARDDVGRDIERAKRIVFSLTAKEETRRCTRRDDNLKCEIRRHYFFSFVSSQSICTNNNNYIFHMNNSMK